MNKSCIYFLNGTICQKLKWKHPLSTWHLKYKLHASSHSYSYDWIWFIQPPPPPYQAKDGAMGPLWRTRTIKVFIPLSTIYTVIHQFLVSLILFVAYYWTFKLFPDHSIQLLHGFLWSSQTAVLKHRRPGKLLLKAEGTFPRSSPLQTDNSWMVHKPAISVFITRPINIILKFSRKLSMSFSPKLFGKQQLDHLNITKLLKACNSSFCDMTLLVFHWNCSYNCITCAKHYFPVGIPY